jgi:RNA polymerase sigma factor (sigma-70 family)
MPPATERTARSSGTPYSPDELRALIESYQRGNAQAMGTILAYFDSYLKWLQRRYRHPVVLPDDIYGEACLSLCRFIATPGSGADADPASAAARRMQNHVKEYVDRQLQIQNYEVPISALIVGSPVGRSAWWEEVGEWDRLLDRQLLDILAAPGDVAEEVVNRISIEQALLPLSEKGRAVFVLRACYQESYEEIGKLLHLAVATCRKIYERTRAHLQRDLGGGSGADLATAGSHSNPVWKGGSAGKQRVLASKSGSRPAGVSQEPRATSQVPKRSMP